MPTNQTAAAMGTVRNTHLARWIRVAAIATPPIAMSHLSQIQLLESNRVEALMQSWASGSRCHPAGHVAAGSNPAIATVQSTNRIESEYVQLEYPPFATGRR